LEDSLVTEGAAAPWREEVLLTKGAAVTQESVGKSRNIGGGELLTDEDSDGRRDRTAFSSSRAGNVESRVGVLFAVARGIEIWSSESSVVSTIVSILSFMVAVAVTRDDDDDAVLLLIDVSVTLVKVEKEDLVSECFIVS
jgi:hypothetical protein